MVLRTVGTTTQGHKIFAATSFWTWRTVAKLIDGIPLTESRELALYEAATGRPYDRQVSPAAVRRLFILAGRRAGKDRFLSAVGVWRAALCTDWRKYQSPGEGAVVILLGRDKKHSAILRRYCRGLLQTPGLREQVVRETAEVTEFRNGASLEIASNDIALVRGRSAIAILGTETCFWKTADHAASSDEEVVAAAEPSMSMWPDGGTPGCCRPISGRITISARHFRRSTNSSIFGWRPWKARCTRSPWRMPG